jgi:hypothetical protein
MNIDMTFWDEVFKTGLFLEKNTFVFIIEGVKRKFTD